MSQPRQRSKSVLPFLGIGGKGRKVSAQTDTDLLAETRFRSRVALLGMFGMLAAVTFKAGWVMGVPDPRLAARGRDQFHSAV